MPPIVGCLLEVEVWVSHISRPTLAHKRLLCIWIRNKGSSVPPCSVGFGVKGNSRINHRHKLDSFFLPLLNERSQIRKVVVLVST
jgi:hypothetical protein